MWKWIHPLASGGLCPPDPLLSFPFLSLALPPKKCFRRPCFMLFMDYCTVVDRLGVIIICNSNSKDYRKQCNINSNTIEIFWRKRIIVIDKYSYVIVIVVSIKSFLKTGVGIWLNECTDWQSTQTKIYTLSDKNWQTKYTNKIARFYHNVSNF